MSEHLRKRGIGDAIKYLIDNCERGMLGAQLECLFETRMATCREERDALAKRLDSARAAMSQANDALESDDDLDTRRAAFERIQELSAALVALGYDPTSKR